jgi:uncharacterized repeat protein (TIGR01451 family)
MRHQKWFLLVVCLSILITGFPATSRGTDFAAPKSYPVGMTPAFIVTGDFNGDSKLDIAVGNAGSNNVSILLGNGDGTFKAAVNSSAGLSPQQMAAGDFNGDGKLDLVVTNSGDGAAVLGSVSLLLGKGDGTFQAPATIVADKYPAQLAVADFNEDKKLDLVVGDLTDAGVTLLLGKGDGTFQPGAVISLISHGVAAMTVGDFNGDKHADVVVGGLVPVLQSAGSAALGLSLLAGNGDGTFQASVPIGQIGRLSDPFHVVIVVSSPHLVAADFNGDGKLDLAVRYGIHTQFSPPCGGVPCPNLFSDDINLFAGNGDGTFTGGGIVASFAHNDVGNLGAGDFNADGKLDLVIPRFGTGMLELGHGDGTFLSLNQVNAWSGLGLRAFVAVTDLSGDTFPDLIVTDFENNAVAVIVNHSPTSGTDLAVTLSQLPPATPIEGVDFSYRATVLNEGPQDGTGVAVKETLPSGLKLVSAIPSQGSCVGTTTITCDLGAMADVSTASIDFAVTPFAGGTLADALQVAGSQADLNSKNDTASFTVTVLVPADLGVSGRSSVTTAATGDKVTYTIQVANAGPGPATNVALTDSISDGNLAVSALTTSQGSCTPTPGNISCAIGTMNSGAKMNISFALTMGPSEGVSNGFSVSADTPDLNGDNNGLGLTVNVNPADLAVSQNATPTTVLVGSQVIFTISVKNNGPAQATNIVLSDVVPASATLGTVQASQGTCAAPVNGAMSCTLGTLAASAGATITFGATWKTSGTETNSVSVSSDQFDPDTSNSGTILAVAIQDFSITPGAQSLTVARGGSGSEVLTFAGQGGFTGNLDLKCAVSGPAPAPTCGISPSTIAAGSTATLTISAALITASLAPSSHSQPFAAGTFAFGLPLAVFGLIAARNSSKNRRGLWLLCILAIAMSTMSAACGGGGSSLPPLSQTYTVVVTATTVPNGIQHSTTIHVTVQ